MTHRVWASIAACTTLMVAASNSYAITLGTTSSNPGYSAEQILQATPGAVSGVYWIDPNGGSHADAFQIYADMTTAGGGWTLGVNSLIGSRSASNDILANTGTVGPSTAQTRALSELAINQSADIRFSIVAQGGPVVIDAFYHGNYHGSLPSSAGWTVISGNLSTLSSLFGLSWSTSSNDQDTWVGNCASAYGASWFYGACFNTIPSAPAINTGPELNGQLVQSFSIYFREQNTPALSTTPLPAALPLFATGLGALGLLGWRRNRKNAARAAA